MGREKLSIRDYFSEVETTVEHNGYFYSVGEALTIIILGSMCGLRNANQIHQWASNQRVREFLSKYFLINTIPCYYWFLCLLKLIKPESLNKCFIKWAQTFIPDKNRDKTISFDGKTIRSTGKMEKYSSPLHIVSAQLAELGLTIGQQTVEDKSNEIPAVRELMDMLKIEGCLVVADALHCQKDTAKTIISKKADYLLNVKENQEILKQNIEEFVQDDELRKTMDTETNCEKNSGRVERRTAYTSSDISWLPDKEEWAGIHCIGAVNTQFSTKKGTTDEWHYYISSREMSAKELLKKARLEWSVETMHWLLDVHFSEDYCRVEDRGVQQNLNIVRKIALNSIRDYKEKTGSKNAISKIMLDCLLDCNSLVSLLDLDEN